MTDEPADEQMDTRLHGAGAAWRAANTVATEPRPIDPGSTVRSDRRRRWLPAASAAVVTAALVTGGVLVLRGSHDNPNADVGSAPLRGTVWQLVDGPAGQHSTATLSIDGAGHLVADDTCQVIGGDVRVTRADLTISKPIVRYKSCTDSVGETVFTTKDLEILRGKASYRISGTELTVRAGDESMHLRVTSTVAPSLDVPTFVGADWLLVRASDRGNSVNVTTAARLRIDDRGKLTAGDGCNGLTATVHGDSDRIRIARTGVQTEVGCPTADVVDKVLDGSVHQIVVNGRLTITKPGVGELGYRWNPTSAATDPTRFVGPTWRLAALAGARAAGQAMLRIDGKGRLTGSDGCRSFSGPVRLYHGTATVRLTFGPPTPCPKAVADQASTIDSFLRTQPLVWAIRGDTLVIGDGAQSFTIEYGR